MTDYEITTAHLVNHHVNNVFGYQFLLSRLGRSKHVLIIPIELLDLSQHLKALLGKWNNMIAPHLHQFRRNPPLALFQIKILPPGRPHLTSAHSSEQQKFKSQTIPKPAPRRLKVGEERRKFSGLYRPKADCAVRLSRGAALALPPDLPPDYARRVL